MYINESFLRGDKLLDVDWADGCDLGRLSEDTHEKNSKTVSKFLKNSDLLNILKIKKNCFYFFYLFKEIATCYSMTRWSSGRVLGW